MRRLGARSWMIRSLGGTAFIVAGCNLILGNDERILVESPSGSGAGGTDASSSSDAGASGSGGVGGSTSDAGGTAGAAGANEGGGGGAGESSAASSGNGAGGATSSNTVGGAGDVGAGGTGASSTGASSTSTSSTGTSMSMSSTGATCECTPGYTDPIPMQTACGRCGTAAATRVCGEDCQWGEYGAPGACTDEGPCTPNEPGHEYGHCTNGRWRDRTRTCGADCQWGPWTEGECQGDASRCTGCACVGECTDADTGGGTTCLWIACSEAEARDECDQDVVTVCGSANQPLTFKEWLPN